MNNAGSIAKVAVTGGTGFIGRRLLERLREDCSSFLPVAIARPSSDLLALERILDYPTVAEESPVRVAELRGDREQLRAAVRGVSHVIHLAAEVDFFPKHPDALIATNVEGTRNLLEACEHEASGTGRRIQFIYVSSTEAIGPIAHHTCPATESDRCAPDCAYGRSKALAEKVVLAKRDSAALDVRVLRPTGVYGPREDYFFKELTQMVEAGLLLVKIGPMDGCIQFSHVDDVVEAMILCLRSGPSVSRILNICPDEVDVTYTNVVEALSDCLGRARPVATIPLSVGTTAISVLSPIFNFGKQRVFMYHPDSLRKTTVSRVYSNAAIKEELGYSPRPMLQSIVDCITGEIEAGRITRNPVSPLLMNLARICGLGIFAVARLCVTTEITETTPSRSSS